MMHKPQLTIHNLSYQSILSELTLSFADGKSAIVGSNGVGKTTLLRLIIGELAPSSGAVQRVGRVAYCPQLPEVAGYQSVAELLGVAEKWAALQRIYQGSIAAIDFELVGDDWMLEERISQILTQFRLGNIALTRRLVSLSGGEITRLWLARGFLSGADFLVLDEPTNNLDLGSRRLLYEAIANWERGLIVVSHDRELLQLMTQIIELTPKGITVYGGNYEFYLQQKNTQQEALARNLQDAQKKLNKVQRATQRSKERHEQRQSRGKRVGISGGQSKLILNAAKERSEQTQNSLSICEKNRLETARQELREAKGKIVEDSEIKVALPNTKVPSRKVVVACEKVTFGYSQQQPLVTNFSYTLQGPARVAITGNNGSGKTTLVKLISGELQPQQGRVMVRVERVSYVDQDVAILDAGGTILANLQRLHSELTEADARRWLASFLFRAQKALQIVGKLSGGERLRAALACVLAGSQPPQLLILDEPTNHLDLASIASLEAILNCYQGALLVISHAASFLRNIGITESITAGLNLHFAG